MYNIRGLWTIFKEIVIFMVRLITTWLVNPPICLVISGRLDDWCRSRHGTEGQVCFNNRGRRIPPSNDYQTDHRAATSAEAECSRNPEGYPKTPEDTGSAAVQRSLGRWVGQVPFPLLLCNLSDGFLGSIQGELPIEWSLSYTLHMVL